MKIKLIMNIKYLEYKKEYAYENNRYIKQKINLSSHNVDDNITYFHSFWLY